jgi:hypothetical protein
MSFFHHPKESELLFTDELSYRLLEDATVDSSVERLIRLSVRVSTKVKFAFAQNATRLILDNRNACVLFSDCLCPSVKLPGTESFRDRVLIVV